MLACEFIISSAMFEDAVMMRLSEMVADVEGCQMKLARKSAL
jgi:hypothetical protein